MRTRLGLLGVVFVLICGAAFGISRKITSYTIERMWSDQTSVYIVYRIRRQSVHVSLADISGTVRDQNEELRLLRLQKESIAKLDRLMLAAGDVASSIYQDSDFDLERTNDGVVLKAGAIRTDLQSCETLWAVTVIRAAPGLFYCGVIYDTKGTAILKLPISAVNRSVVAFGSESLMVVPVTQVKSSDGLAIKTWSMNGSHESSLTVPLPGSDDAYLPQGTELAYSPARIVLRPIHVEDKRMLLCTQKSCQQLPIPWVYSYVVVDEIARKCIFFRQQDLTRPAVETRTISF
jgi:hypothetical protein